MYVQIEQSWKLALKPTPVGNYFINLWQQVTSAYATDTVYPPATDVFNAFTLTPLSNVKVVILGQDPYHGKGQAHGLAFSVPDGIPLPPSLKNIYKEILSDLGTESQTNGNLTVWAKQGALLLNSTLTVEAGKPGSHAHIGWEQFTDQVIRTISDERDHVVFLLWGNHAISKQSLIDTKKHLILTAPHPSPLSAYRGFFGCRHFSKTNSFLRTHNVEPIVW